MNRLNHKGCSQAALMMRAGALLLLISCGSAFAVERSEWAERAQNPMAEVIKLPIENQFNFGTGHKDALDYRLRIRTSMPSELTDNRLLINRLDVPFIYQPGRVPGEKDSFGLGDTTYEGFYGPRGERSFYWGLGPVFQIPTATDNQIGTKKWSAGLGGTGTLVAGPVVAGVRASHLWSIAGTSSRPDVNLTAIEYWLYANLGRGWWIGTSPVNTADWEAKEDGEWTIPVGGGFGRVIIPNRVPINLKLEAYTYAEAPPGAADWSLMLSAEFLFTDDLLFKQ